MNHSGFNHKTAAGLETESEILLPFRSERYLYYKTRRQGMLQFVKKPSPGFEADMLTVEALRKEFLLCYPLSHPAVTRYINFDATALYEEFIDGLTLREMMDGGDERLRDPLFAEKISHQLFEALDYLHAQGVIHLDIKPENLMITRLGDNLKIIDFGCAESSVCDTTGGYTEEYKAPEQTDGQTGCATDIYLGGMVVKELAELSGIKRRWHRFIKGTTVSPVEERVKSAKEALALIPKRKNFRILAYFTAVLVIAVLMWVVWKLASSAETSPDENLVAANIDDSVKDTSTANLVSVEPDAPEGKMEPVTTPSAGLEGGTKAVYSERPNENIEDRLNRDIEQHVVSFYQKNVFPVLKDSIYYTGEEGWYKFLNHAHQALKKGEDDALEFGRKLSEKYPEKESYINSQVISVISTNNTRFSLQLYKQ